jgi:hypothetical protein
MDPYDFDVRLTPEARRMLRPGEALVLDWHRMAICCAGVGRPVSTPPARNGCADARVSFA